MENPISEKHDENALLQEIEKLKEENTKLPQEFETMRSIRFLENGFNGFLPKPLEISA